MFRAAMTTWLGRPRRRAPADRGQRPATCPQRGRPPLFCLLAVGIVGCFGLTSCGHAKLPGTQIRATEANQQVYRVLEEVRAAYEARDSDRLLALTSKQYFEDNGSPSTDDDYGYIDMRRNLLRDAMAASQHTQLSMELYEIEVRGERAHADVRYAVRAHLKLASGPRWETHRDFNRIELVREEGRWKVLSGL